MTSDTDPPYSVGIFETITDVHFGGLAVEFNIPDKGKSYLQREEGIPDFRKAIFSFWFRAPRAALEAVADAFLTDKESQLAGYLPLAVWGPTKFVRKQVKSREAAPYTFSRYVTTFNTTAGYAPLVLTGTSDAFHTTELYTDATRKKNPSFIGLQVSWVFDDHGVKTDELDVKLVLHLQMKDFGKASGVNYLSNTTISDSVRVSSAIDNGGPIVPEIDIAYDFGLNRCLTGVVYPSGSQITTITLADVSDYYVEQLGEEEFFVIANPAVKEDHWHHALLSVDLNHTMVGKGANFLVTTPDCPNLFTRQTIDHTELHKVEDPCKVWIALDDKNVTINSGYGPNTMVTDNTATAAIAVNSINLHQRAWSLTGLVEEVNSDPTTLPTYTYKPAPVPAKGFPFGIPNVSAFADPKLDVEMAEFKMWTGKSIDTANTAVRRLFINQEGKPVTNPDIAKKVLGTPVVTFHGSGNWINGKNTASEKGSPQFDPTGDIEPYKPDPSLNGPQSPKDLQKK